LYPFFLIYDQLINKLIVEHIEMSNLVEVLRPSSGNYKPFVVRYWNWLLGNQSNQHVVNDTLFCRACYEYRVVVSVDNELRRVNNLCGGAGNQVTVNNGVTTGTHIFLPMIDACFNETHRQREPDTSFTEPLMRAACNQDIDRTERVDGRFPTVPTITNGSGSPEAIVAQPHIENHRLEIPRTGTFKLKVPDDSLLKDKLEDPTPVGEFKAVAVGYYIVFKIKNAGTYTIMSSASGPREYRAIMSYHITVE
jgi:hypothetical protein